MGMEESQTVLVVGGAGYIGSHAARVLRKHGYEAVIYDNLSTGHEFLAQGFRLIVADAGDAAQIRSALRGVKAVMYFAAHAYVGESVENPRKYFQNNVEVALTLLNACLDADVKTFVFSSSCAVYGVPERVPISEDNVRNPINPYGISKMFFERALESYDRAYGLRYASLRYFNAAGADESGEIGERHSPETHLIPLALEAASGSGAELQVFGDDYPTPDGTCIRDYVHVNDLAEAHVQALRRLLDGGESVALNLGSGDGYSVKQILAEVERVTGQKVPHRVVARRPGDPPALVADASRARAELGWKAARGLDAIVGTAWKWHQAGTRAR
jgi:UDP-glucose-4-epimerase GalE